MRAPVLAVAVLLAGSAPAEPVLLTCTFETECFDTDGCAKSAFAMEIAWDGQTPGAHGETGGPGSGAPAAPARVTTDAESFEMLADLRNEVLAFGRATEAGDWWTLTIHEEVARLSVHMPTSDLALYYKGTCLEDAP
ncbi:MAG: hypothetical protein AAGF78_05055 [Pseudomonadota bacterium]